jgi:hypothetical protein
MEKKDKYASQKAWQEKAGHKPYAFRVYRTISQAFKEACEKNGVSQASVLSAYMVEYAKAAGIEIKERE